MMIIYGLMAMLVAYAIAECIWTMCVIAPRRAKAGQPSLRDIVRASSLDLRISYYATVSRETLQQVLNTSTPKQSLDLYIRKRFTNGTSFTDWSLDYVYAHRDYSGNRKLGGWPNTKTSDATIWFYNRPKPETKPEPVPSSRTPDWDEERDRLEAFKKHPSAFWLNPDWHKARATGQPFWMHDPAPLPESISMENDFQLLVEELIHTPLEFNDGLHFQTVLDPAPIGLFMLAGRTIKVTRKQFLAAQRQAKKLRGRYEPRIKNEIHWSYY
jgi:hypothetical protein